MSSTSFCGGAAKVQCFVIFTNFTGRVLCILHENSYEHYFEADLTNKKQL